MDKHIVLFDGVCLLCQRSVQLLIKWDDKKTLKFASLQSEFGKRIINENELGQISSIVFWSNDKLFLKSDAVLQIFKTLGGWKTTLFIFKIIPKVLRDKIYDWVANNRYRWFGKQEKCWIPTVELKERFLH